MKIFPTIFLYILLIACTSPKGEKQSDQVIHNDQLAFFNPSDRTKLIDSLYGGTVILKDIQIDSFNCSHTFDSLTRRIEIKCVTEITKHTLEYILNITDTAGNYIKDDFDPSEGFRYDSSYLVLDNKRISITQLTYGNDSTSVVSPVNVWYGKDFGPVGKYYLLPNNEEIFLIRGINFYCNGSNCRNYKVFVLQRGEGGNISMRCFDYPGNYPFNFENTFLFLSRSDSIPSLYFIKKGRTGTSTDDFQSFGLK